MTRSELQVGMVGRTISLDSMADSLQRLMPHLCSEPLSLHDPDLLRPFVNIHDFVDGAGMKAGGGAHGPFGGAPVPSFLRPTPFND